MCKRLLQNYIMHSFGAVANQQKGAAWEYKEPHLQALSHCHTEALARKLSHLRKNFGAETAFKPDGQKFARYWKIVANWVKTGPSLGPISFGESIKTKMDSLQRREWLFGEAASRPTWCVLGTGQTFYENAIFGIPTAVNHQFHVWFGKNTSGKSILTRCWAATAATSPARAHSSIFCEHQTRFFNSAICSQNQITRYI